MSERKGFAYWAFIPVILLLAFVGLMGFLAYIASQQPLNLVNDEYYESAVNHQTEMQKLENARRLISKPMIVIRNKSLFIQFSGDIDGSEISGTVYLYSPLGKAEDSSYPLQLEMDNSQSIDLSGMRPGKWQVNLEWTYNNEDYLIRETIVIQ